MSIIIIILAGIVADLISENLQSDIFDNLLLFFIRIIREILFSTHEIINKYLIEDKFCSVYELSLYSGISIVIIMGLLSIFEPYHKLDNFQEYSNNFNIKKLFVIIGVIIAHFGYILSTLFTNKNNTPCHTFIILVFGQLINNINFTENSIPIVICLIFILVISLIFNEIIEINCCGLSEKTRINIINRANNEDLFNKKSISCVKVEKEDYLIEMKENKDNEDIVSND